MKNVKLFDYKSQNISTSQIFKILSTLKAQETDVLYVHSDLNFGFPNKNLTKKQILNELLKVFLALKVKTLIFPTYTFSFCRNEVFNYFSSETKMGVLNEYIRVKYSNNRSLDPLLSHVLIGKNKFLIDKIGKDSIGTNSTFDLIAKSNLKVKFLFFGSKLSKCFTFMHYLEFMEKINYRYQRIFYGKIIHNKKAYNDSYRLFVRYSGINSSQGSNKYENYMIKKKIMTKKNIGFSSISCIEKNLATECYLNFLKKNKNFFIEKSFNKKKNFKIFLKNKSILSL